MDKERLIMFLFVFLYARESIFPSDIEMSIIFCLSVFYHSFQETSRSVVAKVLYCDILVNEFEL